MKRVVAPHELIEREVHPTGVFARFRTLSDAAIAELILPSATRHVPCPACGMSEAPVSFERLGLCYRECPRCASVYVSPRPDEEVLTAYYRGSEPARYWRTTVVPQTLSQRRDKVIAPQADWIADTLAEADLERPRVIDVGPSAHLLGAELAQRIPGLQFVAAGVTADLDQASAGPEIAVKPSSIARLTALGPADAFVAFDVLDRAADPVALLEAAHLTLHPGGHLFLTAPSASGFDFQMLWERAPSAVPPERLNIFSLDGFRRLLPSAKWDLIELSTPGVFDVATVRDEVERDPDRPWPRFIRQLLLRADAQALSDFQDFLQANRLASFCRIAARRTS